MSDEFKAKRAQAVSEMYRRVYGSMGARVETPVCSICAEGSVEPHEHRDPESPNHIEFVNASPTFLYATMVEAPTCRACGGRMDIHDERTWVCRDSSCEANGFHVPAHLVGIFPAMQSR